jgi:hypothetical protein
MRNGEAKVQLINWPKGQIGLVIFSDFYPEIDINPHMYIWGKSQYTALALAYDHQQRWQTYLWKATFMF